MDTFLVSTQYKTAYAAINDMLSFYEDDCQLVAKHLEIDDAHVYRARAGNLTKTLRTALLAKGLIPEPKKRGRTFAARLPDELFDEITAERRSLDMTNGEYLKWLFDSIRYLSDDDGN